MAQENQLPILIQRTVGKENTFPIQLPVEQMNALQPLFSSYEELEAKTKGLGVIQADHADLLKKNADLEKKNLALKEELEKLKADKLSLDTAAKDLIPRSALKENFRMMMSVAQEINCDASELLDYDPGEVKKKYIAFKNPQLDVSNYSEIQIDSAFEALRTLPQPEVSNIETQHQNLNKLFAKKPPPKQDNPQPIVISSQQMYDDAFIGGEIGKN